VTRVDNNKNKEHRVLLHHLSQHLAKVDKTKPQSYCSWFWSRQQCGKLAISST